MSALNPHLQVPPASYLHGMVDAYIFFLNNELIIGGLNRQPFTEIDLQILIEQVQKMETIPGLYTHTRALLKQAEEELKVAYQNGSLSRQHLNRATCLLHEAVALQKK